MSKVHTSTKRQISRKNDVVTVTTEETVTTIESGKDPVVKVNTKVEKYEGEDGFKKMPEELRKELEEMDKPVDPKLIDKKCTHSHFEKDLLEGINKLRKKHKVNPVKKNDEASEYAEKRAKALAKEDKLVPKDSKEYGECVITFFSNDPKSKVDVDDLISRWEEDAAKYDYSKEPSHLQGGNFTQVVWKDSQKFGAAAAKSDTNKIFVVVAFSPPGNWTGEFTKNVFPANDSGIGSALRSFIAQSFHKSSSSESSDNDDSDDSDDRLKKFNQEGLEVHNSYRKRHGSPPLKLNIDTIKIAQKWADHLAATGKFEHRPHPNKYGENLFCCSGSSTPPSAQKACESWYSEIKDYTFGAEPKSMGTGHFTQMVWKSTTSVGMGLAKGSKGWIVVANYDPPGNFRGDYTKNVPAPLK